MQMLDPKDGMAVDDYVRFVTIVRALAPEYGMPLPMVDGMIHGALCSPSMISPGSLIGSVLGGEHGKDKVPAFASVEQANEFSGLFMKWWNQIATELLPWRRSDDSDSPLPSPMQLPGKLQRSTTREWALGFTIAMRHEPDVWGELLASTKAMWPMYALANDVSEAGLAGELAPDDPKSFFLTAKQSAALAAEIPEAIVDCLHFFHQKQQRQAPPPQRPIPGPSPGPRPAGHAGGRSSHRQHTHSFTGSMAPPMSPFAPTSVNTAPRVGRNSACPCGSGKKYKQCCGAV